MRHGSEVTGWIAWAWIVALAVGVTSFAPFVDDELQAAQAQPIQVSGRITDAAGNGVGDVALRLFQGRRDFQLKGWEFQDEMKDEFLVRTDQDGFFDVELDPDPEYRHFWLRFYDPETFDYVRYQAPEDLDITGRVLEGRALVRHITLPDSTEWPLVQEWMRRLGRDSKAAQLVRMMGVPDRHEEENGITSLWYPSKGVVYRFEGGRYVGEESIADAARSSTGS